MLVACKDCKRQFDVSGMPIGEKVRCHCGSLFTLEDPQPHAARMVHCGSCGGKLTPGASSCDYCGSVVSLADRNIGPACPHCFARMGRNAKFCPECGIEIRPHRIRAQRVELDCPRCKVPMSHCVTSSGEYTECTSCGGLWLDEKFFDRIVKEKDLSAVSTTAKAGAATKTTPISQQKVSYLPCPSCSHLMHRKNFGRVSGIVIDWCKGCGFWFDPQELEQVLHFVSDGGLDRTREKEIADAESRARRAERAARDRTVHTATGGGYGSMPMGRHWEPGVGTTTVVDVLGDLLGGAMSKLFGR